MVRASNQMNDFLESGRASRGGEGRESPLCSHSSIVRRRSGSRKADPHRALLQTWPRNRLYGRDGVEAGRTVQDGNGELEKLTQERGDSDEIKTVKARLISATGTGP